MLTCVWILRCWMCEVEPMCVDADGVGCGRRGALLSPGWGYMYAVVLGEDGEARCCRLVDNFFIFCLRRGGGYMYS